MAIAMERLEMRPQSNEWKVKSSMESSMHVEYDDQCLHRERCINESIVDDDE